MRRIGCEIQYFTLNKMSEETSGFIEDLSETLGSKTGISRMYNHVLICGMVASAVGDTVFADSMYYSSRVSVDVTKALAIPRWVDRDTLIVVCSYSGNTREILSLYDKALDAGLDVVAITHGGKPMELPR